MSMSRRIVLTVALSTSMLMTACVGLNTFRTFYEHPVSSEVSGDWRLAGVKVTVPRTLSVSEERSIAPNADIVWREDKPGDRYAQVEGLVRNAAQLGAKGLKGSRPVRVEILVSNFHALTFEAEALRADVGVHNVDFTIRVVDARTGEILAGPDAIEAAMPAMTGGRMIEARVHGETQRSQITAHLRKVIAGWLGTGPDVRGSFTRVGE